MEIFEQTGNINDDNQINDTRMLKSWNWYEHNGFAAKLYVASEETALSFLSQQAVHWIFLFQIIPDTFCPCSQLLFLFFCQN